MTAPRPSASDLDLLKMGLLLTHDPGRAFETTPVLCIGSGC